MRSNCIVFALALYWRRERRAVPRWITIQGERYFVLKRSPDGVRLILLRASRLGSWFPHMLYAERRGGEFRPIHFVPNDQRVKQIPPPWFSGFVKRGDWQDTEPVG